MNLLVELLAIADHAEGRSAPPAELWAKADPALQDFYRRRAERIINAGLRVLSTWMSDLGEEA